MGILSWPPCPQHRRLCLQRCRLGCWSASTCGGHQTSPLTRTWSSSWIRCVSCWCPAVTTCFWRVKHQHMSIVMHCLEAHWRQAVDSKSFHQVLDMWHDVVIASAALAPHHPAFRAALAAQQWARQLAALSEQGLQQRLGASRDVASPAQRLVRALAAT